MKHSYGIILFRYNKNNKPEIFLGKAGHPRYWGRDHDRLWCIPKGKANSNEKGLAAALREFKEEVGVDAPNILYKKLVKYHTPHNKLITVFVGMLPCEKKFKAGNSVICEKEWPVGSGEVVSFSEFTDTGWFSRDDAVKNTLWAQRPLIKAFFVLEKMNRNVWRNSWNKAK